MRILLLALLFTVFSNAQSRYFNSAKYNLPLFKTGSGYVLSAPSDYYMYYMSRSYRALKRGNVLEYKRLQSIAYRYVGCR